MRIVRLVSLFLPVIWAGCVQPQPTESTSAGNQNPIIRNLTADPPIISVGSSCTLTADALDPDGDPLTYQWYASAGDIIGQGPSVRYTASFCCTGSNRITVTVKDNRGGSTTRSIEVAVLP
jgi:hypothetical protein